jgi:hypothetical protein
MSRHVVEVDQSGKIGDTKVPTVLAFSNDKKRAILIPATVKRACLRALRKAGKGEALYYLLFATGLFLLLKDDMEAIQRVTIDIEYRNKEARIREHLLNLLQRAGKKVAAHQIQFDRIHRGGKKPAAHDKAYYTYRRALKPDRVIGLADLLEEFRP